MKLLMIIVDTECREEVEVLFRHNGVTGYSEIPNAHGIGLTGIRMGSRAHPKTSSIFFTVVEAEQVEPLKKALCSYCEACERHMKMIQWGVEEVV
jgi:hypothetical protein